MDVQIDEKTPGFDQLKPGATVTIQATVGGDGQSAQVQSIEPAQGAESEAGEDPAEAATEDPAAGGEMGGRMGKKVPALKTTDDFYNHFKAKEDAKYPG